MSIRINEFASGDITPVERMLQQQARAELNGQLRIGPRWLQDLPVDDPGERR